MSKTKGGGSTRNGRDSNAQRLGVKVFDGTTVLEIMSPWPPTIGPDLDVREAAQQMLYFDAQRLFVEDEGALVGVISQSDVVAAVARARVPSG